jgi:ABC-type phosphate/phosphonate transport system substrate-binding protein
LIAALEAYDWPEVRQEIDRFWRDLSMQLARRGIAAPQVLDRHKPAHLFWQRADVLVGQTCSLPYRQIHHRRFAVLGPLCFAVPGCEAGAYHSVIIARPGLSPDVLPRAEIRVAVNSRCSQSGWAALNHWLEKLGIEPGAVVLTGSHRASLQRVAEGQADIAAIDAVSWHLAMRFEPAAKHVTLLGHTPTTPGLPLVTSRRYAHLVPRLREAVWQTCAQVSRKRSPALPILGFAPATDRLYRLEPNHAQH